jgi:hypothetical protein
MDMNVWSGLVSSRLVWQGREMVLKHTMGELKEQHTVGDAGRGGAALFSSHSLRSTAQFNDVRACSTPSLLWRLLGAGGGSPPGPQPASSKSVAPFANAPAYEVTHPHCRRSSHAPDGGGRQRTQRT